MRQLWPLLLLLLASCGSTRKTVQEGMFQRRTLKTGWHVDLHRSGHERNTHERIEKLHVLRRATDHHVAVATERPLASTEVVTAAKPHPSTGIVSIDAGRTEVMTTQGSMPRLQQETDEQVTPTKEMNKLAIPAFVLALLTIGAGFTLQSVGAVAAMVVATVVLAAVALKQIRTREQRGKGFALVALIIGLIAALFTTLVILWTIT